MDPLVVPQPGIPWNSVGLSDFIRSDRILYRIHSSGKNRAIKYQLYVSQQCLHNHQHYQIQVQLRLLGSSPVYASLQSQRFASTSPRQRPPTHQKV
ncbi:unnamed protein product [Rotaria magnacalcarata]|uniref:Uncharacterized protein n=1 Tax=Rotaria magnacalcarata TaxID=392030 RepID=A0A819PMD7_9BILA|nr:unnamed protein product [Rotaria magnacalcarata]CAF4019743.1 unnamed protein product [Rotaria magnacalcarata]